MTIVFNCCTLFVQFSWRCSAGNKIRKCVCVCRSAGNKFHTKNFITTLVRFKYLRYAHFVSIAHSKYTISQSFLTFVSLFYSISPIPAFNPFSRSAANIKKMNKTETGKKIHRKWKKNAHKLFSKRTHTMRSTHQVRQNKQNFGRALMRS